MIRGLAYDVARPLARGVRRFDDTRFFLALDNQGNALLVPTTALNDSGGYFDVLVIALDENGDSFEVVLA